MKSLFLLGCMLLVIVAQSQQIISQTDNARLKLTVACYKKEIYSDEDIKIILEITNLSDTIIPIPSKYKEEPYPSPFVDLTYEIIYCSQTDSQRVTDDVVLHVQWDFVKAPVFLLSARESYFINPYIPGGKLFFSRNGKYLIRFRLRKESLPGIIYDDLETEWIVLRKLDFQQSR